MLGLAGLLAIAALWRPLSPGASPRLRLAVTLLLGLGVAGSALLASLRGRGSAAQLAFYAFLVLSLDAVGQLLAPWGWPAWPLFALLVGALAVAEPAAVALGAAALASLFTIADAAAHGLLAWRAALAATLGYTALVLALQFALKLEKRRLRDALAKVAKLEYGIDQLGEDAPEALVPLSATAQTLRQVSEEGRRARQVERIGELSAALARVVRLVRPALSAHAALYFDLDTSRECAFLRAADGPPSLIDDAIAPLGSDPFAFVRERRQAFYATDYSRLLWALPWYRAEVRLGSLLAVPVKSGDAVVGVLVADSLEVQAFTRGEPELLASFAALVSEEIARARASLTREEMGAEFKAVYAVSRDLAGVKERARVRRLLLGSARQMVHFEAGAIVMTDRAQTRYVVEEAQGWAADFEGREVALDEKTWAAWVLRSAEEPYLLDHVEGRKERMPFLVLDEGGGRAESLLAVPLKAPERTLGAMLLMGPERTFSAAAYRVLGVLANQAAAVLAIIQHADEARDLALRDGLTGLYNRRAFDDLLAQSVARESRRGGQFALLLLDVDRFKQLNDTYGHPAGDAVLAGTARELFRHLRKGDQAARYGGEEFAVVLPGADEAGALQMAERVREAIERAQLVFEGARLSVTVSVGIAVWPAQAEDEESLIAAADRALYAAKQAGRNRLVSASSLGPVPPPSV